MCAAIFAVSITLRSLDLALCDEIKWQGRATGTHFAWHLLNAIVLFLLIRASLEVRPSLASAEDGRMLETEDEEVAPEAEEGAKEDDAPEEKPKALFPA